MYFDCLVLSSAAYVYKAKQGSCILDNLEYRTLLTHDVGGFRNADSKAQTKVVLIGDSHTHGVGVNDEQTFASLLERQFGHSSKNLGMGSYATKRELEALRDYSTGEQYVVIQYSDNDVAENRNSLRLGEEEFHEAVRSNLSSIANSYKEGKSRGLLQPLKSLPSITFGGSLKSKQDFYSSYKLRDIGGEAEDFAQIVSMYRWLLDRKKVIVFESSAWGINHPGFKSSFQGALSHFAPWLNVTVLDMTNLLSHDDYYYFDDHLNPAGHEKIAKSLNAIIRADSEDLNRLTGS
jgi:lysophospholipase L1-like esterase